MTWFCAFLRHIAAFALVADLAVKFVLVRDELTVKRVRQLQFADLVFGASAGVVLLIGFLL